MFKTIEAIQLIRILDYKQRQSTTAKRGFMDNINVHLVL